MVKFGTNYLINDKCAQLGFTDIDYTKQPDGFGWNDYLDNPNDPYYIR